MAFALIGRAADSQGMRVLAALDPAFSITKAIGLKWLKWLWGHPRTIGIAVTAAAMALGVLGVQTVRRRARPFLLLLTGFTLATWGQLLLWHEDATAAGVGLYLGGVFCAVVLGRIYPMPRLAGFPALPSPADPTPHTREVGRSLPFSEWALVFGLTFLGLLFRGYALTENPSAFDGEMTSAMLGGYTHYGIGYYMKTEFLGTSTGVYQVLTYDLLYRLFGASIFTIRLTAIFWGVLAIPLLYWLARRIAGQRAAIVATLLFIAAPEQLFWSRSDNTHFAQVALLGLVTAHLGLSMQERFAPRPVVAAALWMPLCRYSYTASYVLFALPLLLAAHATVFVRGVLRRLRYAAPILLGGLLLWIFGLSFVEFALQPERGWRFFNPAMVQGQTAWRHDVPEVAGPLEVLRAQGIRVARNAGYVLAGMTQRARFTSHWYVRYVTDGNTIISAGLAVLCALGIGYLLGQIQERRAALLLIWIAIGLLPGCMSSEPEARRISVIFPALPIVAGVFVVASAQLARKAAGRRTATATIAALGVAIVLTAFAGLASNLLLPTAPIRLNAEMHFAEPLFERCDMILHNLQGPGHEVAEIGALDAFVRGRPGRCIQLVQEKDWPDAALLPRCDFTDRVFNLTLSAEERELRRKSYHPTRVGYLLMETRESGVHVQQLRRLFPSARTSELPAPTPEGRLFAMEVPLSAIEALRTPEVSAQRTDIAAHARGELLKDVELTVASRAAPDLTVRGGLLLPDQDWYRFRLEPACPSATLTAGTPSSASAEARPLLAGIHPFTIRFRAAADCRLPLVLRIEGSRRAGEPIPLILLAPRVVEAAQAVPVGTIPGYGEPKVFARLTDRPMDVGVDGKRNVFVLTVGSEGWKVHRFTPEGKEEAVYNTELTRESRASLLVDAEGNCILVCLSFVEIHDRSGRRLQSWKTPYETVPSDAALLPDGQIIFCFPNRGSVESFSREGHLEGSLAPAGKRLASPVGVTVAHDGSIVVLEETGIAHVFASPLGRWPPPELASFLVAYPEPPYPPDLAACAFDGTKQVLFPHRSRATPLIYDLKGRPLMASAPEHDLSAKGLKEAHSFCSTPDALYMLDSNFVIRVSRL